MAHSRESSGNRSSSDETKGADETKDGHSEPESLLVFSIDIDGCAIGAGKAKIHRAMIQRIIERVFESLLEFRKKYPKERFPTRKLRVRILSGSARQTRGMEQYNHTLEGRYKTLIADSKMSSSVHVLEYIVNILNGMDGVEASCEPLLMEDLKGIESFEALQKSEQIGREWTKIQSLEKDEAFANFDDESKISLTYAQMHYLALAYPGQQITYIFLDDRLDIQSLIFQFYREFPQLIPLQVRFEWVVCSYGQFPVVYSLGEVLPLAYQTRRGLALPEFPAFCQDIQKMVKRFTAYGRNEEGDQILVFQLKKGEHLFSKIAALTLRLPADATSLQLKLGYYWIVQLATSHVEYNSSGNTKGKKLREHLKTLSDSPTDHHVREFESICAKHRGVGFGETKSLKLVLPWLGTFKRHLGVSRASSGDMSIVSEDMAEVLGGGMACGS